MHVIFIVMRGNADELMLRYFPILHTTFCTGWSFLCTVEEHVYANRCGGGPVSAAGVPYRPFAGEEHCCGCT